MESCRFGLLGELSIDDGALTLKASKLRALLAALLLRAGRPVSQTDLAEQIWDEPPSRANSTLQVYVVRLRQALGGFGPSVVRSSTGYRIDVDADQVDLHRFRALVARRDADARTHLGDLREALSLWRGPALADVVSEAMRFEADRLDEERLVAVERRIELEIELGAHRELVPELRTLTRRHPLRERFAEFLMLALHRGGRSADALAIYRLVHRMFADELGVRPGRRLAELHDQILCGREIGAPSCLGPLNRR
ncbi:DNA-binding transcriptional activator of the SARP family [Lentzea waywayandensis]|uniref:DNA-binding transcriptional activator of the SARP family n=1 Tax=Lentzea waywayandensis TaxID=84724 RepID=A0A1I6E2Z2_9PSEU|nr:AfsR/SARP family transcriptional regulator [Lentzea waywayandensis]SFR11858.1 DNA-binding transcriptional activator of the SARP family [Lentzea waywayandensis]